ncbi:prepilin peptidase [Nocardia sp. NBC_00508]|uniref:prepilin peptidase n=1 Tax=Nocardia sp. NBC_00508 TaxID=2975992 RepID=UPI002E80A706|nr:prepilin peptidase [Nocardia sp. NBC_00508]WUD65384.1 prepilin peptidase [Nocardia sp. NBC_00508]
MSPFVFTALATWSAALTVLDLRERRLPNRLTGFGALAILGYALITGQFTVATLGAVFLAGPYLLVHLAAPTALGAGDVKLALGLGGAAALGGAQAWVWAALGAPALTACIASVTLAVRRLRTPGTGGPGSSRLTLPHGPSMCLSTLLALMPPTMDTS